MAAATLSQDQSPSKVKIAADQLDLLDQLSAKLSQLDAMLAMTYGEAGSIPAASEGSGTTDVHTLMRSEAYSNAGHPDPAKVSAQVRQHYERRFGNAEVR